MQAAAIDRFGAPELLPAECCRSPTWTMCRSRSTRRASAHGAPGSGMAGTRAAPYACRSCSAPTAPPELAQPPVGLTSASIYASSGFIAGVGGCSDNECCARAVRPGASRRDSDHRAHALQALCEEGRERDDLPGGGRRGNSRHSVRDAWRRVGARDSLGSHGATRAHQHLAAGPGCGQLSKSQLRPASTSGSVAWLFACFYRRGGARVADSRLEPSARRSRPLGIRAYDALGRDFGSSAHMSRVPEANDGSVGSGGRRLRPLS